MLDDLLTEQTHPSARDLDSLPIPQILSILNSADAQVPDAVAQEIPRIAAAVEAIARAIEHGGHLVYLGAGSSGRLGVLDASECPPTFNVSPDLVRGIMAGGEAALSRSSESSEDDPDAGARDLLASGFGAGDVLVGIAASGRTPYVLGAVAQARALGAITCGISCTADSELSRAVDYPIEPKPGPEVLAGSTRLRAGTATKLVLNLLTTGAMIRLGKVHGNLMVDVRATNAKLRDRAERIVMAAAGATRPQAKRLLAAANGQAKLAILMHQARLNAANAQALLAASDGVLSKAMEAANGDL